MPIDPTAQTEPLTAGQRIVAEHEKDLIAEPAELAARIDRALGEVVERMTPPDKDSCRWRCFHCGEGFNSHHFACEHFGATMDAMPACQIKSYEGHLVAYIRKLEDQLESYRRDDTDLLRAVHSLEADVSVAKRDAEQLGYDRGLRDAAEIRVVGRIKVEPVFQCPICGGDIAGDGHKPGCTKWDKIEGVER